MTFQPEQIYLVLAILAFMGAAYVYQRRQATGGSQKGVGANFTTDLSALAEQGKLDPVSGRDEETDRLIHVLMRRTKNNPLLIGQPGVGKTAVVEGLALRIAQGNIAEALKDKRVLVLDMAMLVGGTKYRGELENRLKKMIDHLESLSGRAILFIDEIHMLEQIGKSEGSLHISDVLKPALARGLLRVIGATTWHEYETYLKPDEALNRRFQPVLIDEPTEEETISILKHIRGTYEEFHHVKITDEALEAAVKWSDKKIKNRYLPDKAIDLIDEASAKVAIDASTEHMIPAGAIHTASKNKSSQTEEAIVDVKDIQEVFDQWMIHSTEEQKRDARKN